MTKEQILKKYFGYDNFWDKQEDIINHVLAKKDTLVLMPTGGGKSVCFQIPAIMSEGTAIVVSPLIALMKDQVEALRGNGVEASFLNSSLSTSEMSDVMEGCRLGKLKLLYVSPERLQAPNFYDFLQKLKISLFAIDEAHCISAWGHDFRPEYTKLHVLKEKFPDVPVIALTATADKVIRKDILTQLNIPEANLFIASFDRPNLSLTVLPGRKRLKQIVEFLKYRPKQPGIIYCLSRKSTEDVSKSLSDAGFKAKHYHAGMDNEYRSKTQDEFIRDEIQIICATIAFGMGIDKSNVRWIIHYNLPKNIESFYQEIGRAGRDGAPADTLLFYSYADVITYTSMISESDNGRQELLQAKLDRIKQYAEAEICRRRILLSYFNETIEEDCGNCDVCKNPPQKFDATLFAQKAMSAIARTEEKATMTELIDILRGSHNKHILDKGYDKIKTYGSGKDVRYDEWADYIFQMLNSGYIDIAYDEGYALKLNPLSWKVLKGQAFVKLAKSTPYEKRAEARQPVELSKKEIAENTLFERLRALRKNLADQQGVPAYVIFSDKTLTQMTKEKPLDRESMMELNGVTEFKFDSYGSYFLDVIINFVKAEAEAGNKMKGATFLLTWDLYKQGKTPSQMAKDRNLSETTIMSHLAALYEKGYSIDLKQFIADNELLEISKAIETVDNTNGALKPVFDQLQGKYDYSKIRIAMTLKNKKTV